MASTNKTPHLGLCQWVETDPFLREDMNDTLSKIDEAYNDVSRKRLLSAAITGPTPMVVLDLSEIDLTPYCELEIYYNSKKEVELKMRINGVADNKYIYFYTNGSHAVDAAALSHGSNRLLLFENLYVLTLFHQDNTYRMSKLDFPQLNSIEIYGSSATNNFDIGERITVWGVRM